MIVHLSVKDASKRVKRTTRTIESWINDGPEDQRLPVVWVGSKRFVEEQKLLAVYRQKLGSNPARKRQH